MKVNQNCIQIEAGAKLLVMFESREVTELVELDETITVIAQRSDLMKSFEFIHNSRAFLVDQSAARVVADLGFLEEFVTMSNLRAIKRGAK